jgi:glutamate-1-semialdehyde aminotransferase
MLEHGVFMLPVNLKRNNLSFSHKKEDIDKTLDAAKLVLQQIAKPQIAA